MFNAAVIFDVDGPLLELTAAEEDAFFAPFKRQYGLSGLSPDWDEYKILNDLEIYSEILDDHMGRPPSEDELTSLMSDYFDVLRDGYASGALSVVPIPGALALLQQLSTIDGLALGTATANFGEAARQRLSHAQMWPYISRYPGAAGSGGAKSEILRRVIADLGLPGDRIVFLGDNLNDLEAGKQNGVHFIGFHIDERRRDRLTRAGARIVSGDHETTWTLIRNILGYEAIAWKGKTEMERCDMGTGQDNSPAAEEQE